MTPPAFFNNPSPPQKKAPPQATTAVLFCTGYSLLCGCTCVLIIKDLEPNNSLFVHAQDKISNTLQLMIPSTRLTKQALPYFLLKEEILSFPSSN